MALAQGQCLHGRHSWLPVKYRVYVLYNVGIHIQEITLVFDGYKGSLGAIILGYRTGHYSYFFYTP